MLILLFRSSTATANFLFPHFCVEGKEREGEREKDLVTDQPLSVSTFRAGCLGLDTALLHLACTLAAREREMPSLSPGSCRCVSCASLRGLFVRSRVTAACEREETKKWKEADVPPRPLPVRISGHQLRLAANFRSIIAMREDDSPNHSPTDDPPNSSRINKFKPPRSSR